MNLSSLFCTQFFIGFFLLIVESSNTSDFKKFLKDCSIKIDEKQACSSLEPSYFWWQVKYKSKEKAISCLFSQLANRKLSLEQRNEHLILLHSLLKSKTCAKSALRLVNLKEKVSLAATWNFLGAFQIGKQELDGNPSFNENILENRWNKNFESCSELAKSGIVHWKNIEISAQDGTIQLMPDVEWNDLVMSMQSLGMTEWQGMLINDFMVSAQNLNVQVQCLGVSHFYVNNKVFNGDVYHRNDFWNPIKLDVGIHTLLVPVRLKGPDVIKCFLKGSKNRKILLHLDKIMQPDFVDGNLFSSLISIPISNLHGEKSFRLNSISIDKNTLPGFINVGLVFLNAFSIKPGQISTLMLNITNKEPRTLQTRCPSKAIHLSARLMFTGSISEDIQLQFRCRSSKQSFIFTFLDHDNSIQTAAAIKPLKPCETDKCPVLLTLHGTGVAAESQADSYKQMINKKFVFGVEKMWVLAPTRHGAHNWEGPGEMTSLSALKSLAILTSLTVPWIGKSADDDVIIFAGHSMGGHGAWQLSTHHPDKAIGVISAAGWLSKEDYGDSNLFYRHDVSVSHTDPYVKMIQESCISENQNDKHASNLKGLPIFMRIGGADKTVHPYFSRRMFRLLKENDIDVKYQEIPGKEHWWWDTAKENDGGVTNDQQIRKFIKKVIDENETSDGFCSKDGCDKEATNKNKYKKNERTRRTGNFRFVVYNPASFSGGRGILIIQQQKPLRKSTYDITISQETVVLVTRNIQRIRIYEPKNEPIKWLEKKSIMVDNNVVEIEDPLPWELCKNGKTWKACIANDDGARTHVLYGPARRIAEKEFVIVICEEEGEEHEELKQMMHAGVFLSNLFFLTSNAFAPVKVSRDVNNDAELEGKNVILLGKHTCIDEMKIKSPIEFKNDESVILGNCHFPPKNISVMYLHPKRENNLFLVLSSNGAASMTQDVLRLAIPTIPPMTRSPFSNLLPDYVIFTPDIHQKGPGGYLCSGFWDNNWGYDASISSCPC